MENKEILENAEMDLAVYIDQEVYYPVKKELEGCGRTYSLGFKKENLKGKVHEVIKDALEKQSENFLGNLKQVMYGKLDWIQVFKDAHASRKTAWHELGHIQEWRNATDEVLFAVWKQLEPMLKKELEVENGRGEMSELRT